MAMRCIETVTFGYTVVGHILNIYLNHLSLKVTTAEQLNTPLKQIRCTGTVLPAKVLGSDSGTPIAFSPLAAHCLHARCNSADRVIDLPPDCQKNIAALEMSSLGSHFPVNPPNDLLIQCSTDSCLVCILTASHLPNIYKCPWAGRLIAWSSLQKIICHQFPTK